MINIVRMRDSHYHYNCCLSAHILDISSHISSRYNGTCESHSVASNQSASLQVFIMDFTSTTQGKRKLVDGGYMYVHQKNLANGVASWECEQRRRETCKAKVKVLNDQIVGRVNVHTHGPNNTKVEVTKVRVDMKRRAETTIDAPHRILSDGLAQASAAAAVNLPHLTNVPRTIRRYRANGGDPVNPRDRAVIPVIPNEYQLTNNN